MKRVLVTVLILFMAFSSMARADSCAPDRSFVLEGPGFDTPEEAVLAYIEAWNNADLRGMLSTFAI